MFFLLIKMIGSYLVFSLELFLKDDQVFRVVIRYVLRYFGKWGGGVGSEVEFVSIKKRDNFFRSWYGLRLDVMLQCLVGFFQDVFFIVIWLKERGSD